MTAIANKHPAEAIFVTGTSSGIGAATAAELAQRGFAVGCLSRRGIAPEHAAIRSYQGDVTDEPTVVAALSALVSDAGRLLGVVNCAGRQIEIDSLEMALADARALMDTNFFGVWTVSRLAQPYLAAAGGGTIVNVGSFYDRLGVARNAVYAASKAAIGSLTRCLAVEWAGAGIRVLNVAPGYIETDINRAFFANGSVRGSIERRIPVHRVGQPEEIGRIIAGIFAESVGFLTGETIYVDGGQGISL
jgi:NAD(P)-dependent dehydrogenase (short-subunit alcohol dehydrogenase family)